MDDDPLPRQGKGDGKDDVISEEGETGKPLRH
jgi:hypothetical protein